MALQLPGKTAIIRQRKVDSKLIEFANKNRSIGLFNDVVIKVGNASFPANRLILACFSHYFEKMFTVDMKERHEGTIVIDGVDEQSWKILFNFIYSGSIVISCENVMGVLAATDYLQVDDAKQICFEFLESVISVDSCFVILNVANMYNNACLQTKVYNFVSAHFVEISQSLDIESLSKNVFFSCVSNLNHAQVNDVVLYETMIKWIKVDEEARKHMLPKLLIYLDFTKLSAGFLKQIIATEKLITENLECANLLMKSLVEIMNTKMSVWPSSKIFSVGGAHNTSKVSLIYNHFDDVPQNYPDVPQQRLSAVCAIRMDEFVYCIGGQSGLVALSEVWRLNVNEKKSKWGKMAPMLSRRCNMGASVFRNMIVVTGGCDSSNSSLNIAEVYCVSRNNWSQMSGLNSNRFYNAQVTCNGCVYSLGGTPNDVSSLSSVEKLNNIDGNWQFVRSMLTPRNSFAGVRCKGKIYVIGGWNGSDSLKTVECYLPQTDQWMLVSSMHDRRDWHAACELQGKIYVAGGVGVKSIDCYDPSLDLWSIIGRTDKDLVKHSLFTV